jgi:hypothetical protein
MDLHDGQAEPPQAREIRGELFELELNIPRRRKTITRLLQSVREKLDGLVEMETRQRRLESRLKKLKEAE